MMLQQVESSTNARRPGMKADLPAASLQHDCLPLVKPLIQAIAGAWPTDCSSFVAPKNSTTGLTQTGRAGSCPAPVATAGRQAETCPTLSHQHPVACKLAASKSGAYLCPGLAMWQAGPGKSRALHLSLWTQQTPMLLGSPVVLDAEAMRRQADWQGLALTLVTSSQAML